MASDGRAEFDPSEIARVDFPTAFRGYDQDAVRRYLSRLAAAVGRAQELGLLGTVDPDHEDEQLIELELEAGRLRQRIQELEVELAEDRPAADATSPANGTEATLDEAELIKLLGQETARILETARSAAADLMKRAENEAAELKARTERDSRAVMDEAEGVLADARAEAKNIVAEAEAEAVREADRSKAASARTREDARVEAERVRAEASGTAETELAAARREAAQLVDEAEQTREQILGDLVTRRRISREQLVVMNAARDRLAVALASARSELDDVTSVLQRAAPAKEEIDVRDPSPEQVASRASADDGQQAEIDELTSLLDRSRGERPNRDGGSRPGGSSGAGFSGGPASGGASGGSGGGTSVSGGTVGGGAELAGVGSSNGSSSGPSANGASTNGASANGASANGALANGASTNGSGGLPMEYLTVDQSGAVAVEDEPSPMKLDDLLILADGDLISDRSKTNDWFPSGRSTSGPATTDRSGADRLSPDLFDGVVHRPDDLRMDGFGGLVGGAAPALGSADGSMHRSATRGDLPRTTPYAGVLPTAFEGRDIALNRATPGFRRRLKRAVNDDQSEVLEGLRAGRGAISASELPPLEHQLDIYIDALRPVLFDVVTSGAEMLGCLDIPVPSVESLCLQLARHVVECLRGPAVAAIERATSTDREEILDPIRVIYRDFRNAVLPDLIEDALHEAFALGLYHAVDPSEHVLWVTDPRLDPDPICEDNSASRSLPKGTSFPSGHPRPLSMPGCRCLVIPAG